MGNSSESSHQSEARSATILSPSFRKPGSQSWEPLQTSSKEGTPKATDDDIRKIDQAKEVLQGTLLQSLQMQHLIVLAGSGCSYCAGGPTMSDLWKAVLEEPPKEETETIAKTIGYDLTIKNIEYFLSQTEAYLSFNTDETAKTFFNNAKKIILEKCRDFSKDKLTAHETLLHRLSRRRTRDQRLRIFTTNYDLCFEIAATKLGCVAIDGFSFTSPRRYDPRFFDYDIIRRPRSGEDNGHYLEGVFLLYKLHGSVNWEQGENSIIEKEHTEPEKACLIYPASGKYQQSYNQPFIESISQYLMAIREPNTCLLVMGFGFNDDHLSKPLLSAVRSNPHLRLIVVARSLEESKSSYLNELKGLSENGADVWLINESFEDFVNRIPDLKSLTPAERLAKAINGAIQLS